LGKIFGAGDTVAKVIFFGFVGLLVALILYAILRELFRVKFPKTVKKEEAPKPEAEPLYAPESDKARILLESADKLAEDGRFEDAVHLLLFRSIQDIDEKKPNAIRQSFTSREIAGLGILTPATREAFSLIARVVETSFFGGSKLGRPDYDQCRAAYAQFAIPGAWAS
jgi:hypothetical protein